VKASTRVIIILSVMLAASVGCIIYSTLHGDQALRDAQAELAEGLRWSAKVEASNAALAKSNLALITETTAQAGIMIAQSRTIATLKAEKKALLEIAGAAVGQGADLNETYKAGSPIVSAAGIPALMDWYNLMGLKIVPLLISIGDFNTRIGFLDLRIVELEAQNTDLLAGNGRMQGIIDADTITIADQGRSIAGLREDLKAASDDVQAAMNRAQFGELMAWICGGAAVLEGGALLAHLLGAW
jgi:hypothetical protein